MDLQQFATFVQNKFKTIESQLATINTRLDRIEGQVSALNGTTSKPQSQAKPPKEVLDAPAAPTKNSAPKVEVAISSVPPSVEVSAIPPAALSPKRKSAELESDSTVHMSNEEFRNLNISVLLRKAITEVMKYQYLTKVQASSLPVILQGADCLAKAKTGTGKTLGFLIPAAELMSKNSSSIGTFDIPTLVISPTRELASQIAEEAKALLTYHARNTVVCIFGGVKIAKDQRQLQQPNIAVLVATPGRLMDHLQNTEGFGERLKTIRMVVLDEADQLLDMGFKPAIDRIFHQLPVKEKRQTLLFSATVPKSVEEIARLTLRTGFAFVDTVGEVVEQTHEYVLQELLVLPQMTDLLPTMMTILQKQMTIPNYKILVFCTTARIAGLYSEFFNAMGIATLEIHSRMSQSARTKASDEFRLKTRVVMFSSDVSARGMDYPDVTFVLQVGSTEKAQYIHRLGRTARAGKEGSGMLLLYSFEEQSMMKELEGLPLKKLELSSVSVPVSNINLVHAALGRVESNYDMKTSAEQAYQAWLGYYNGRLRVLSWSKPVLVEKAAEFARSCGLNETPALEAKTIGKMGLRGTPGLKVKRNE